MITVTQLSDTAGTLVFTGAASLTVTQAPNALQVTANVAIAPIDNSGALQAKINAALVEAQQTVTQAQQTVTALS